MVYKKSKKTAGYLDFPAVFINNVIFIGLNCLYYNKKGGILK